MSAISDPARAPSPDLKAPPRRRRIHRAVVEAARQDWTRRPDRFVAATALPLVLRSLAHAERLAGPRGRAGA